MRFGAVDAHVFIDECTDNEVRILLFGYDDAKTNRNIRTMMYEGEKASRS